MGHNSLTHFCCWNGCCMCACDQRVERVKQRSRRVSGWQHAALYTPLDHATMPNTEQQQRMHCLTATATYCYYWGGVWIKL